MRKQREHNCIYPLAWALILCLLTALCLSPAMAIDEIVQQPTSSISAVAESLRKAVKYSVENFTGMLVDAVNVHVVGVRV